MAVFINLQLCLIQPLVLINEFIDGLADTKPWGCHNTTHAY